MSGNTGCSVYIGNLDERVSERVLYDILIQAGRVVDLYIPRDKETDKPKGFGFAEYESEDIADYAVRLFSGLVTLYNRTLKFAISGQDKSSQNPSNTSNSSHRSRHYPGAASYVESAQMPMKLSIPSRISDFPARHSQVPPPPGVSHYSNEYGSHFVDTNYEYNRRVSRATTNSLSRPRSRRYDASNPISYSSY